jgi:cytochrome c-type biogenesis protein CcmH/NrfG
MESQTKTWSSVQAFSLAAICLLIGAFIGYAFYASGVPMKADAVQAPGMRPQAAEPAAAAAPPQVSDEQLAATTREFSAALAANSNDLAALAGMGNAYYDAQRWQQAVEFYDRALKLDARNVDIATDAATAIWYMGQADQAIARFESVLRVAPNHANALFNLGVVRWQGKGDSRGAVQAWDRLLKSNPDYPQREQVEALLSRAKEHAKRG